MQIRINFEAGVPTYRQIVDQVKSAAAAGSARAGDPLPAIRALAEELRVNRNTVAKAYTQLESEGVIESQQGRGSFIAANASPLSEEVRLRKVAEAIDTAIVQAHHLQVDRPAFIALTHQRLDAHEAGRGESPGR